MPSVEALRLPLEPSCTVSEDNAAAGSKATKELEHNDSEEEHLHSRRGVKRVPPFAPFPDEDEDDDEDAEDGSDLLRGLTPLVLELLPLPLPPVLLLRLLL